MDHSSKQGNGNKPPGSGNSQSIKNGNAKRKLGPFLDDQIKKFENMQLEKKVGSD